MAVLLPGSIDTGANASDDGLLVEGVGDDRVDLLERGGRQFRERRAEVVGDRALGGERRRVRQLVKRIGIGKRRGGDVPRIRCRRDAGKALQCRPWYLD